MSEPISEIDIMYQNDPGSTKEEIDIFCDMFNLFPIYSELYEIPPLTLIQLSDGEIISDTWESSLKFY